MSHSPEIGDGIRALNRGIDPTSMSPLIETLTRWVDPKTFRLLPVWFPETARKQPIYKAGWNEQLTNRGAPKFEPNIKANKALSRALGVSPKDRPNWTCCHIWGNDDEKYASDRSEVNDPRYYSCPANMILLPSPLKSFTDFLPQIKVALRLTAFRLFGFLPAGRTLPTEGQAGEWMPGNWRNGDIQGIVKINSKIRKSVEHRRRAIQSDFQESPGAYPNKQVEDTMHYWSEKIPEFNFGGNND